MLETITDYGTKMLSYISNLYSTMNKEKLNLAEIKNAVDAL